MSWRNESNQRIKHSTEDDPIEMSATVSPGDCLVIADNMNVTTVWIVMKTRLHSHMRTGTCFAVDLLSGAAIYVTLCGFHLYDTLREV